MHEARGLRHMCMATEASAARKMSVKKQQAGGAAVRLMPGYGCAHQGRVPCPDHAWRCIGLCGSPRPRPVGRAGLHRLFVSLTQNPDCAASAAAVLHAILPLVPGGWARSTQPCCVLRGGCCRLPGCAVRQMHGTVGPAAAVSSRPRQWSGLARPVVNVK